MSKQSLSPGFKESLTKITSENAIAFATKVVEAFSDLESKYNAAQGQLETAASLIEEQSGKLEDQAEQLQKAKTENPNYRPIAQNKKDYFRVNHPIREAGEILSIDQIAKDLKLVLKLYDSQSTAITKLTAEEIENLS